MGSEIGGGKLKRFEKSGQMKDFHDGNCTVTFSGHETWKTSLHTHACLMRFQAV